MRSYLGDLFARPKASPTEGLENVVNGESPTDTFSHEPLDLSQTQIRLLAVDSSRTRERGFFRCKLKHFDVQSCPAYTAVSYTWGDLSQKRTIILNGCAFTIRENLWDFLAAVHQNFTCWYWIDAICIDQSNVRERNHQVDQMGEIYMKASETIVWLGPSSENTFDTFLFIRRTIRQHVIDFRLDESDIQSLSALWSIPYWKRVWVIQEIMLSRTLLIKWGEAEIPWTEVALFMRPSPGYIKVYEAKMGHSGHRKKTVPQHVKFIFSYKDRWRYGARWAPSRRPLSHILDMYRDLECSDVRDKVYGLLGLVHKGATVGVDYSRSALDVWLEVLRQVAESEWDRSIDDHLKFGETLRRSLKLGDVEPGLLERYMTPAVRQSSSNDPEIVDWKQKLWRPCEHLATIDSMAQYLRDCKKHKKDEVFCG